MDVQLVLTIIGFSSLILERIFAIFRRFKKSECTNNCCKVDIEMSPEEIVVGSRRSSLV